MNNLATAVNGIILRARMIILDGTSSLGTIGNQSSGMSVNTDGDFEGKITKPVMKFMNLLMWGVMVAGVIGIIWGVIDLKDAMETEGSPVGKKKSAIIKIGFGVIMTAITPLLKWLGVLA